MTNETGRIEAFSDGVFSIAATLLVLELKAPPASQPFWHGLAAQWPERALQPGHERRDCAVFFVVSGTANEVAAEVVPCLVEAQLTCYAAKRR